METTIQQATVGKSYRVAIQTKYLSPTNYRGSRLKVWHGDSKALTLSWDYSLDTADNHAEAVQAYLAHMGWDGQWIIGALPNGTGYVAVWGGHQC
jgi:hypothetical protein